MVDLPPRLVDLLRARQLTATDPWVFPGKRGGYFKPKDFVQQTFDPVLKRAGLPRLHLHDLRHRYASLLIAQGVDPKYICGERWGTRASGMTFDAYGHLFARTRQQASACLEQALLSIALAPASVSPVTADKYRPRSVHP